MQPFGPHRQINENFDSHDFRRRGPGFFFHQNTDPSQSLQPPSENRLVVLFRSTFAWLPLIADSRSIQNLISVQPRSRIDRDFENNLSHIHQILKPFCQKNDLEHLEIQKIPQFLNQNEKEVLNVFFNLLFQTPDFENRNYSLYGMLNLNTVLKNAFKDENFCKTVLIPLAFEAAESCTDKTAITFNRLCLESKLSTTSDSKDLKEFAKILIGYARLQLLHEEAILHCKKKGFKDEVEVMLFLQTNLAKSLELPLTVSTMAYPFLADISDAKLKEIQKKITFRTFPRFKKVQILNTELSTQYNEKGKIVSHGKLSTTNPYLIDINEVWSSFLKKQFPTEFEKNQIADEMLFDPKALQSFRQREKNIQLYLTEKIINNRKK